MRCNGLGDEKWEIGTLPDRGHIETLIIPSLLCKSGLIKKKLFQMQFQKPNYFLEN
jgi:hypothetical protein